MRIRDFILLGFLALWLIVIIVSWIRRIGAGGCAGCSGAACGNGKKEKKRTRFSIFHK